MEHWQAVWQQANAKRIPPPELPAINFDTDMVIGVMMGDKRSGGYEIRISDIRDSDDRRYVLIEESGPGDRNPPPPSGDGSLRRRDSTAQRRARGLDPFPLPSPGSSDSARIQRQRQRSATASGVGEQRQISGTARGVFRGR